MPLDDLGQGLHHDEASERSVFECRLSGVSEAQAPDYDVEISARLDCQTEFCESDLR